MPWLIVPVVLLLPFLHPASLDDQENSDIDIKHLVQSLMDPSQREQATAALLEIGKPAVTELSAAVRGEIEWFNMEAAKVLGMMGKNAVEAIPDLIRAIHDWDKYHESVHPSHWSPFFSAHEALRRITYRNKEAVPYLVKVLEEEECRMRIQALNLLAELGNDASASVPDLTALLRSTSHSTREAAIRTLMAIGTPTNETVSALAETLKGTHVGSIRGLPEALIAIGEPAVPPLSEMLINANRHRGEACRIIGRIGPAAHGAVPQLCLALQDPNYKVRWQAANALGEIGENARSALPDLMERLKDDSPSVRSEAAKAICRIDPTKKDLAIPVLIKIMRSRASQGSRISAAEAIQHLGLEGEQATEALAAMVLDKTVNVRKPAALALAAIGPGAKEAMPSLIEALGDDYVGNRVAAAGALVSIDPKNSDRVLPVLISALADHSIDGRYAAEVLATIGAPALPSLIKTLQGKEMRARSNATIALGMMGSSAQAAVEPLIALLTEEDFILRSAAARALGKIGRKAKKAVPLLEELLRDRHVRTAAAEALRRLQPGILEKNIPLFIEVLHQNSGTPRQYAIQILGDLGPAAEEAIPALQELLFDWDTSVQDAARYAIQRITGN